MYRAKINSSNEREIFTVDGEINFSDVFLTEGLYTSVMNTHWIKYINFLFIACLCYLPVSAMADAPTSYHAEYAAKFQGFRASAEMSLTSLDENQYQLNSSIRVKLFGKTMSSINEASQFIWHDEHARPLAYSFRQTGLGKRERGIDFSWNMNGDDHTALTTVEGEPLRLDFQGQVFDEYSMYNEIKRQVALGIEDIYLTVIDEDELKQYHYAVLGEEYLETPLGLFAAIKVERIRAPESTRVTQLWLAKDWEFLLLKLYQRSSRGKESQLNLRAATLGEIALSGLEE